MRRSFATAPHRLLFCCLHTEPVGLAHLAKYAVSLGGNAGPQNLVSSEDDSRLVITDYFLNKDAAELLHSKGDHKVHVLRVTHDGLAEDKRFQLDFNTAFRSGPARPHGIAMK